jgi:hypothetical protein
LKRIASGKTGANDFGNTFRALEEGDKERRDGAQGLRQYPYELWGGMLMAFAACLMKSKEKEFRLVFVFCVSKRWTKSNGKSKIDDREIISYNSLYKLNPMMYSSEG